MSLLELPSRPAALDPVVLKFGGSVLRSPEDVPAVVSEIYRHVRAGRRVVAVVSALRGDTDRLLAQARALGQPHDNAHLPRYVAFGEEQAAALVAIGCDRVGLNGAVLGVGELGLLAEGDPEAAAPLGLAGGALAEALARHEAVIVPGFAATDLEGRVVLLGRGGSDLSAVVLAAALGQERVRLIKDVDGIYDRDPHAGEARRFDRLDWAGARAVAGRAVQPGALDAAQAHGVEIEVAALGRDDPSRIGGIAAPAVRRVGARRRRVMLAGCGVVGGGVLQRLLRAPDAWEVAGVLVRDPGKPREVEGVRFTDDPAALLDAGAEVLVEVLSDGRAGEALIRRALSRGVDVVGANKQALAADLPGLHALARANGARLAYSAAVGGGAPMIETVRAARAQVEIAGFEAVLNGTVNFVLDRLAAGAGFDAALAQARAAGFAEEDSSADLDGRDAAAKLRILAWEAFGRTPAEVACDRLAPGLAADAAAWRELKQVSACGPDGRAEVRLRPTADPLFRGLRGERNALRVTGADGRAWVCRGRGAGRWPTTESVLADLGDLQRAAVRA